MGQPGLFFIYFRSFSNKHQYNFTTINVKKCPSSIRHRDSNPRPLERESPPITTRPGLPPLDLFFLTILINDFLDLKIANHRFLIKNEAETASNYHIAAKKQNFCETIFGKISTLNDWNRRFGKKIETNLFR